MCKKEGQTMQQQISNCAKKRHMWCLKALLKKIHKGEKIVFIVKTFTFIIFSFVTWKQKITLIKNKMILLAIIDIIFWLCLHFRNSLQMERYMYGFEKKKEYQKRVINTKKYLFSAFSTSTLFWERESSWENPSV